MPNINKANRKVANLDIRDIKTRRPVMFYDKGNTTTQSFTGDSSYAMAGGTKAISFANPIEGTATIEAQVYPFKLYALMSNGIVESTAVYPDRKIIKCEIAGELTIPQGANVGTVFVFAEDDFGGTEIKGTYTSNKFTATTASDIAVGSEYNVGYMVTKNSGVNRLSFNNSRLPKAYYISMDTVEKDEEEVYTGYKLILYKAQPQRNFELSQTSTGDPATLKMTFDLLEDKDGNFVDMIEIEDDTVSA